MSGRRLVSVLVFAGGSLAVLLLTAVSVQAAVFGPSVKYQVGNRGASDIVAAQLTGDGRKDIAVAHTSPDPPNQGVSVMPGLAGGAFGAPKSYDSYWKGHPRGFTVGDFNRDGRRDILVPNHNKGNVALLLGTAGGSFLAPRTSTSGYGFPDAAAVGDLNGDGKLDFALAHPGEFTGENYRLIVTVHLGDGTGGFAAPSAYQVQGRPYDIKIADLNRDGNQDIVTADQGFEIEDEPDGLSGVSVLLGTGGGRFTTQGYTGDEFEGRGYVAIDDLDADGLPDLAVGDGKSVKVMRNVGDGRFSSPTSHPSGGSLAISDVDGDGFLDIVAGRASVLLGKGDATFRPVVTYSGDQGGKKVIADFDGDGRPDLAAITGSLYVSLNTTGTMVTGVSPATGPASGGTRVTITGARFTGARQVQFGNTSATSFTVLDDRHVVAVAPPGTTGVAHVRVVARWGISPKAAVDHFTYTTP